MENTNNNILEIKNLHTYFYTDSGVIKSVDGVDIELREGTTLGIVGESGSGKSVTALSVLGLVPPAGRVAAGEIRFGETDLRTLGEGALRKLRGNRIAMIFQEPMTSLNPVVRVGKQVGEVLKLHTNLNAAQRKERVIEMFRQVSIPEAEERYRAYPFQLSGGLRQRIMIAMAMICNPRLLIADEPTTALDVTIEAQILHLMRQLKQEFDTSILMITHNLGIVSELCDVVNVMYLGEIVEHAATEALFETPMHPYTQGLIRSVPEIKESDEPLENIPGMVPDLKHVPTGCRFCERCRYATERCRREKPELTEAAPGHQVRCFRCEAAKKEA